jgi:hypothetical protein
VISPGPKQKNRDKSPLIYERSAIMHKEMPFLKKSSHLFSPKQLLKRSLSHSARVLTSKANQIKEITPEKQTFEAFQLKMRSPNVKVVAL